MSTLIETVRESIPQLYGIPLVAGKYKNPPFKTAEIPYMDYDSFRLLQEQVFRSGRKATVLAHPYAGEDNPEALFPATEAYCRDRDNLITTLLEEGQPVIIFEPDSSIDQLKGLVNSTEGVLFTVRTVEGDVTPELIREYTGGSPFCSPREISHFTWKALSRITDVLQKAGVRHLTVGGRYLGFHEVRNETGQQKLAEFKDYAKGKSKAKKWLSAGLIPSGCVGDLAYRFLQRGFDVSFSSVSSPANNLESTDFSAIPKLQHLY